MTDIELKKSLIADFENSEGGDQVELEILLENKEGAGASLNCTEIEAVSFEKVITVGMGSF